MPRGIAKNGINKGWFKKGHKTNLGLKHSKEWCEKHRNSVLGEKSCKWKGGKTIDGGGYILIKKRNHPFADHLGYIREHRLVMEKHLGRHLNPKEVVHHINKIQTDNRIENLQLFKNVGYHTNHHRRLNKITKSKS